MNSQKITACAFLHKDNKLFIARRADTKKFLPGKYELPGGHIEFGENVDKGLEREIMEEFGVNVIIGNPFYVFTYTNNESHSVEIIYFVTLQNTNQEIKINPKDHSEYRWISENESLNYFDENDEEYKAIKKGFEILNLNK